MKILILVLSIISLSLVNSEKEEKYLGRCGPLDGDCLINGECCGRFGFCGKMDAHCHISKGCQPQYGACRYEHEHYDPNDRKVYDWELTPDGKCGVANKGVCPLGQCCSKEGECGTTDEHCLVTKGCKSLFGDCKDDSDSFDDSTLPDEEIPENKGRHLTPNGRKMILFHSYDETVWYHLYEHLDNKYATAALMGNIFYETKIDPYYVSSHCLKKYQMTNKFTFQIEIDKGRYSKLFLIDGCGYGIISRHLLDKKAKKRFLELVKTENTSIADIDVQVRFFLELLFTKKREFVEELLKIKSLERACIFVAHKFYKRPLTYDHKDEYKKVIDYATFYYNFYRKRFKY